MPKDHQCKSAGSVLSVVSLDSDRQITRSPDHPIGGDTLLSFVKLQIIQSCNADGCVVAYCLSGDQSCCHGREDFCAVGRAEQAFTATIGMGHHAEHITSGIADSGDVFQ
jgi:hypothetical protein